MTSRGAGGEREDGSTHGGRWQFGMEEEGETAPGDGEEHCHGRHHEGRRNERHRRGRGLKKRQGRVGRISLSCDKPIEGLRHVAIMMY